MLMYNVLTPTESEFLNKLSDKFNIDFMGDFKGRSNYKSIMNFIRFEMSRLLKGDVISVAYQVVMNDSDYNKYPDFLLSNKNKSLRIEIKNSESERMIAREINSISNIKDSEYWFVVFNKNIKKIKSESIKKDSKIKILSYDEKLFDEIEKFFSN